MPDANTAYLVGGDGDQGQPIVLKSVNASAAAPAWADQNYGSSACKLGNNGYAVTDVAAVPGAPNSLIFVIDFFAGIFPTSDGLASPVARAGELVNNYGNSPRIARRPQQREPDLGRRPQRRVVRTPVLPVLDDRWIGRAVDGRPQRT